MNDKFTYSTFCLLFRHLENKLNVGTDRVSKENFIKNKAENYEIIKRKTNNMTYKFTRFNKVKKNNRRVCIPTIRDRIVIEYLKRSIQNKYKISLNSREKIISDIRILLSQHVNYYIFRTDVKGFFNNIDHRILFEKLKNNSLFTVEELVLIENILKLSNQGLPQGISISNYLAEIFMEKFDIYMKNITPGIAYYARYVDDIVLIFPGKLTSIEIDDINKKICRIFEDNSLQVNQKKTKPMYFYEENNDGFEYLGYLFYKDSKKLLMKMAGEKKKKFFKKVDYIFKEYNNNNNYELLYERIKVLTSVNKTYKNKYILKNRGEVVYFKQPIFWGINYDYRYITDQNITQLNNYIKRWITSSNKLTNKEKKLLFSLRIKNNDENYRLIAYEKIPIMHMKSIIYKISIPKLSWGEVLQMNKNELVIKYFEYCKITQ